MQTIEAPIRKRGTYTATLYKPGKTGQPGQPWKPESIIYSFYVKAYHVLEAWLTANHFLQSEDESLEGVALEPIGLSLMVEPHRPDVNWEDILDIDFEF